MAERTANSGSGTPGGGRHGVAAPRMGLLAGGAMGVLGFALAVFFGLAASNPFTEIIKRALVVSAALVVVGAAAGAVAGGVIRENARRLASELAESAEAAARARDAARAASRRSDGEAKDPPSQSAPSGQEADQEAKEDESRGKTV